MFYQFFRIFSTNWHPSETEDNATLILYGSEGEIITLTASNTVRGSQGDIRNKNDNNIRIWGECGQLIINDNNIEFYSLKNFEKFPAQNWHNIEMKNKKTITRAILIDNFGERIKSNKISNFNEDGIMSLAIVEAAYKSSVENRPISINEVLKSDLMNNKINELLYSKNNVLVIGNSIIESYEDIKKYSK